MLEEAIKKLENEMEQNRSNNLTQIVGDYLIEFLNTNNDAAENILTQDTTILKSIDAMRNVAEKKKTGNYAILTREEGYKAILNYFGIELIAIDPVPLKKADTPKGFDIKLEDFLS